jgi:AGCS family alanine or glycine:cation symporter
MDSMKSLEKKIKYLTMLFLLKLAIMAAVYFGCVRAATIAWDLGDMGVGIMAWLNVIAIIVLQKPALLAFKDFERQRKGTTLGKVIYNLFL